MRPYLLMPLMLLAASSLSACDYSDKDVHVDIDNYISIHSGSIAVHAPNRPDADISAAGDLSIAGKSVTVSPTQRDLLKHYYATALTLRDHGIATGEAGAAVAGKALSSVAAGLASGNTDKIDAEVNASAAKVTAKAALICDDLAEIRSTQQTLAGQLEVMRPYALIKADEADRCRAGLDKANHSSTAH